MTAYADALDVVRRQDAYAAFVCTEEYRAILATRQVLAWRYVRRLRRGVDE